MNFRLFLWFLAVITQLFLLFGNGSRETILFSGEMPPVGEEVYCRRIFITSDGIRGEIITRIIVTAVNEEAGTYTLTYSSKDVSYGAAQETGSYSTEISSMHKARGSVHGATIHCLPILMWEAFTRSNGRMEITLFDRWRTPIGVEFLAGGKRMSGGKESITVEIGGSLLFFHRIQGCGIVENIWPFVRTIDLSVYTAGSSIPGRLVFEFSRLPNVFPHEIRKNPEC